MLAEERIPQRFHLSFKRVPVEEPPIAGRRAASAAAPREDDDREQQGRRTGAHLRTITRARKPKQYSGSGVRHRGCFRISSATGSVPGDTPPTFRDTAGMPRSCRRSPAVVALHDVAAISMLPPGSTTPSTGRSEPHILRA
jgi:hypothetical protein